MEIIRKSYIDLWKDFIYTHKITYRFHAGLRDRNGKFFYMNIKKWDDLNIIKVDNVKFTFTDDLDLIPEDFPKPVIQLEFEVVLPWLLEEKCT